MKPNPLQLHAVQLTLVKPVYTSAKVQRLLVPYRESFFHSVPVIMISWLSRLWDFVASVVASSLHAETVFLPEEIRVYREWCTTSNSAAELQQECPGEDAGRTAEHICLAGQIQPVLRCWSKTRLHKQDTARPAGVGTYRSPVAVRVCSYPLVNMKYLPLCHEQQFRKDCVWRSNKHGKEILYGGLHE